MLDLVSDAGLVYDYCEKRRSYNGGGLPRVREILDESLFFRTLRVLDDGRVYYIDHLVIGYVRRGVFVSACDFCRWFPRSDIRKVRGYLQGLGAR
ncbi:MAG: hypothetical protein JEY99_21735 [Spirochaetales bacterium]|nr:hypothetical protein [Spirochaetales bacterium]